MKQPDPRFGTDGAIRVAQLRIADAGRRWAYGLGRRARVEYPGMPSEKLCVFRKGSAHEKYWVAGFRGQDIEGVKK